MAATNQQNLAHIEEGKRDWPKQPNFDQTSKRAGDTTTFTRGRALDTTNTCCNKIWTKQT